MQEDARTLRRISHTHGFVRVLVILVQFSDHTDRPLPPVEHYNELFNGQGRSDDIIPTGSVKSWMDYNSYGNLQFEAEVIDWTITDNTELYYSFDNSGLDVELRKSMYPALDQLERDGFDFSRFDQNNDGVIDSLMLLHSGYAAEVGGEDCESGHKTQQRIWSHAIGGRQDNWVSESSGIRANGYSVSSGLRGMCHNRLARISVITHEYIHTMGLPDLNDGSGEWIGRGLGDWDVMSNAHGRNGAQMHPAFLSPWSKIQLGWLDPIEITRDGVYSIEASEVSNEIYVIRNQFPLGESLVIENRQPELWDSLLWDGGLLIWHMDDAQNMLKNRGYPGQEDWPGNGVHYALALAAADGNYDMEVGINGGDDSDYWRDGAIFGPGPVESEASSDGVYPNTNSYQQGNIRQTGIVIDEISASGAVMSFRVQGVTVPTSSPTAAPTRTPTSAPSFSPTVTPTSAPTVTPSVPPTSFPTLTPSALPTPTPSASPTATPTMQVTDDPSGTPSSLPSATMVPSWSPSNGPSTSVSPSQPKYSNIFNGFGVPSSTTPADSVGAAMHTAAPTSSGTTILSVSTLMMLTAYSLLANSI